MNKHDYILVSELTRIVRVAPVEGDDGASIQAAIDEVSALEPDADGFRGAVLLRAGTYEVAGSLSIRTSGVVLRGEWPAGCDPTVREPEPAEQ
jgi:hypothetical protein